MCYGYSKMRYPRNSRLGSWSVQLCTDYVDFLFGQEVWGFVAMSKGKAFFADP